MKKIILLFIAVIFIAIICIVISGYNKNTSRNIKSPIITPGPMTYKSPSYNSAGSPGGVSNSGTTYNTPLPSIGSNPSSPGGSSGGTVSGTSHNYSGTHNTHRNVSSRYKRDFYFNSPLSPTGPLKTGIMLYRQGKYEEAINAFDDVLKTDSENKEARKWKKLSTKKALKKKDLQNKKFSKGTK